MHTADSRMTANDHFFSRRAALKRNVSIAAKSRAKASTESHSQPAEPKVLTNRLKDQAISRSLEE